MINNEKGVSTIELLTGIVIFLTISAGVTTAILTINNQVNSSVEASYDYNKMVVAGEVIEREVLEAVGFISQSPDSVHFVKESGEVVKISATQPNCELKIEKYADQSSNNPTSSRVLLSTLSSCNIFSYMDNNISINLEPNSEQLTDSYSKNLFLGYFFETKDTNTGNFIDDSLNPRPAQLLINNGVGGINWDGVKLSFSSSTLPTGEYTYQYSIDGGNTWTTTTVNNMAWEIPLSNVSIAYLRIRAVNANGTGTASPVYMYTITAPVQPAFSLAGYTYAPGGANTTLQNIDIGRTSSPATSNTWSSSFPVLAYVNSSYAFVSLYSAQWTIDYYYNSGYAESNLVYDVSPGNFIYFSSDPTTGPATKQSISWQGTVPSGGGK
jgi:hypothetical protein